MSHHASEAAGPKLDPQGDQREERALDRSQKGDPVKRKKARKQESKKGGERAQLVQTTVGFLCT